MGKEPVLDDDGAAVGYVTSAAYGFSVDESIAYAWLPATLAAPGSRVAIQSFGEDFEATVRADPLFDPDMARLRV
jgi:glycine cleavage system aminomethyltransferase T